MNLTNEGLSTAPTEQDNLPYQNQRWMDHRSHLVERLASRESFGTYQNHAQQGNLGSSGFTALGLVGANTDVLPELAPIGVWPYGQGVSACPVPSTGVESPIGQRNEWGFLGLRAQPHLGIRTEADLTLSYNTLSRALRFVSWLPEWDGSNAVRIDYEIALQALALISAMRAHAGEPNVSPGSDGSLLLEWTFPNGSAIEVYVEHPSDFPDCAVIEDEAGEISEVALNGATHLSVLLADRALLGAER